VIATASVALLLAAASAAFAQTRLTTGAPGPDYWQQRADYSIAVALDEVKHEIRGRVTIRYHNNAPDALPFIYLQLDQNLFRFGAFDGFILGDITQDLNGRRVALAKPSDAKKTIARLTLAEPLARGSIATLHIDYAFLIPMDGYRMGRALTAGERTYAIAQWYPRVAVYDDVVGWNTEPYRLVGEFYLEYGDFDYAITLPGDYVVTGTGTLENATDVLTDVQQQRLESARGSEIPVAIITRDEASARRRAAGQTRTWRFRASNVRDVAWAASPAYAWDAATWNGVLVQSVYLAHSPSAWDHSTELVRHALATYSRLWSPYPYPTAINVATPLTLVAMEYPMMAFQPLALFDGLERLTLHEFAHQWFPMIVGSNERLHAWMDEGFATFLVGTGTGFQPYPPRAYEMFGPSGRVSRIVTAPGKLRATQSGSVHYHAPRVGLVLLRESIIGPAAFDAALREYTRRWAYKHPTPADFFNTMNDVLGEDLSWFWKGWFETTDRLDQAIESVTIRANAGAQSTALIQLASPGRLRFPVKLRVSYADGTYDDFLLPVTVWNDKGRGVYEHTLRGTLASVEIDPDGKFPDERRGNNAWRARRAP
jgi:hypothetical protein